MTLKEFFSEHNKVALAFSGGVDSSYLLYAAVKFGCETRAYFVNSVFQPDSELIDARNLASGLGVELRVVSADVLKCPVITSNPPDRCYHCKRLMFSRIAEAAARDGFKTIIDGTNASDSEDDRPGMRALRESNIRSPLRECGLTKPEIRRFAREAGLSNWDKPSYACLATRIPTGTAITMDKLIRTEKAEDLLASLGFSDFRIRFVNGAAKLELREEQIGMFLENRPMIQKQLEKYYSSVLPDIGVRK